jgi:hypothetical protein
MIADWITSAKQALTIVKAIDNEKLPSEQQADLVSLGQHLWSLLKHGDETLDVIKARLRLDASSSTKVTDFTGPEGHCKVVPQVDSIALHKDTNIADLKAKIGEVKFAEFFETVVTYKPRKGLRDNISAEDPYIIGVVLGALDVTPRTARVTFEDQ